MSLIIFLTLLVASLAVCGICSFYFKKEKISIFITLKALAVILVLCLALVSAALYGKMLGSAIFICLAISIMLLPDVLSSIPTKTDMFGLVCSSSLCISSLFILMASFLLVTPAYIPILVGFAAGAIGAIIYFLVKKAFNYKTDILKFLPFVLLTSALSQAIYASVFFFSIANVVFLAGVCCLLVNEILRKFFIIDTKAATISKNILYYLGLILLSSSIFLAIF